MSRARDDVQWIGPGRRGDSRAHRTRSSSALSLRTDGKRLGDIRAALAHIRGLTAGGRDSFRPTPRPTGCYLQPWPCSARRRDRYRPEVRKHYTNVPWLDMIDTRSVAIHECHRLDAEVLWSAATESLRPLD